MNLFVICICLFPGSLDFNQQNLNKFTPSTLDRQNHFSKSEGDISRSIMMLNENLVEL